MAGQKVAVSLPLHPATHRQCPNLRVFFGIVVRMYYDDHPPPHVHVEYQGQRAKLDFQGRVLAGRLSSRTALHRIREWMELHPRELMRN